VLSVDVLGLEDVDVCASAVGPAQTRLALPDLGTVGFVNVEVRHRGETDAYRVEQGPSGPVLAPVRTSVTRPAGGA
jgi:hypothetical protein